MHLTNSRPNHHLPVAVSDAETAGAPACEIEVTAEMIEAGVEAACLFDADEPEEWKVSAVFRAMVATAAAAR